jgi:hypothetical protein
MDTVRNIVLAAAAAAAMVASAGTAGADPTPPPSPGYQIPGPNGPQFPGAQVYRYDPDTGTWNPSDAGGVYRPCPMGTFARHLSHRARPEGSPCTVSRAQRRQQVRVGEQPESRTVSPMPTTCQ